VEVVKKRGEWRKEKEERRKEPRFSK